MKTLNKTKIGLAGSFILIGAVFFVMPLNAVAKGTDILHLTIEKGMSNPGVEPGADGSVVASQKMQGKADNQKMMISVNGLAANATYELVAVIDTDTNVVDVAPFVTDGKGAATLQYVSLGNGHGGGKHSTGLPDSLNPLSLIREIDIVSTNSGTNVQVVLSADLSRPDKLQYLIKRDLGNGDVDATLMIQATAQKTSFRLFSTGLTPDTDYLLAFNGEVVQINTSSSKGRLDIHSLNDTPPDILDVRSVELWDTSSNVVLQAQLP